MIRAIALALILSLTGGCASWATKRSTADNLCMFVWALPFGTTALVAAIAGCTFGVDYALKDKGEDEEDDCEDDDTDPECSEDA